MPVLNVANTAHVLILNYDRKPGYAGVDNPLYTAPEDHVCMIEGNAKETLADVLQKAGE